MMYKNIRKNSQGNDKEKFIRNLMICYLVIYSIALLYNFVLLAVGKANSLFIPIGITGAIVPIYVMMKKRAKKQK